jgi:hypothetical protein
VDAFFASGRAADLITLVIVLEGLWLWVRARRRTETTVADILLTLGPGLCLVLALRAALTDAHWIWIAAPLAASLPLHLLDVQRRRIGRR